MVSCSLKNSHVSEISISHVIQSQKHFLNAALESLVETQNASTLRPPEETHSIVPRQQTLDCFRCTTTGVSRQTEAELAVRQLHAAGRTAVSSHDPSLTHSHEGCGGEDYRGGYKVVVGED